jgi:hypothetical protein
LVPSGTPYLSDEGFAAPKVSCVSKAGNAITDETQFRNASFSWIEAGDVAAYQGENILATSLGREGSFLSCFADRRGLLPDLKEQASHT